MKFVVVLLASIAASSGSSAPSRYDGPKDQVQVTQVEPTGARSLRGRQKRRPCAKSIATYCTTEKNAAR